jgi:DedD protein
MTELISRSSGNQLWLTRSHLAALGTSTVLIAVLAFMLGYKVGARSSEAPAVAEAPGLLPVAGDRDSLEALLREVEQAQRERASAQAQDAQLTFPTALRSPDPTMSVGEAPEGSGAAAVVPPPAEPPAPPSAGEFPPPASGWAIQIAAFPSAEEADARVAELRAAEAAAYRVAALIHGETWYRVRVGGFPNRDAATQARAELASALGVDDLIVVEAP